MASTMCMQHDVTGLCRGGPDRVALLCSKLPTRVVLLCSYWLTSLVGDDNLAFAKTQVINKAWFPGDQNLLESKQSKEQHG